MVAAERVASTSEGHESVPSWVRTQVLPATGAPAESVQVLRNKAHKSAVVFARGRTYVAEKPLLRKPRLYEVYFPEEYVVSAMECPHCQGRIEGPFRRVEVRPRTAAAPTESAPETSKSRKVPETSSSREVYVGKNYELIDVEGIGETYAARLKKVGIGTTADLLAADPASVAEAAEASPAVVEKWRSMAELMLVKGIGKQFAELLVRSGVTSIDGLKGYEAAPLLSLVTETQEKTGVRIQGAKLNRGRVKTWIDEARRMKKRPVASPLSATPPKSA